MTDQPPATRPQGDRHPYEQYQREDHNLIALALARQSVVLFATAPRSIPGATMQAHSSADAGKLEDARRAYAKAVVACQRAVSQNNLEAAETFANEADDAEALVLELEADLENPGRTRPDGQTYRVVIDGTEKFFDLKWRDLEHAAPGRHLLGWIREEADRAIRGDRDTLVWRENKDSLVLREYIAKRYALLPVVLEEIRRSLRLGT